MSTRAPARPAARPAPRPAARPPSRSAARSGAATRPRFATGATNPRAGLRVPAAPTGRPAPSRDRRGVLATAAVVVLFASIFGIVVFQVFLMQAQGQLDEARQRVESGEARARELRVETAQLESPERIAREARDRLGMIAPAEIGYLQPRADDAERATFDPVRDAPRAPSTTVAATAPRSPGATGAGAATSSSTTAVTTTTVRTTGSTPTTAARATTPTTVTTTVTTTPRPATTKPATTRAGTGTTLAAPTSPTTTTTAGRTR